MSVATFLTQCWSDVKAAEARLLNVLPTIKADVDATASFAAPIVTAIDPTAGAGIKAVQALFDEFATLLEGTGTVAADGTVNFTVSASTVAQAQGAISDAKNWLASVGIKL